MRLIDDVVRTVVPSRAGKHGPLPLLLLGLTVVTGLVDAFSYLLLGHVFVANMTGNVVFLGFAAAGTRGFSIPASLFALAAFVAGALLGGRIASRIPRHRGRLLATATALQALLFVVAVVVAAFSGASIASADRYTLIVVMAVAMGVQNATVRKLGVPDLTTTVLTLTITGVAADRAAGEPGGPVAGRRLLSVLAIFIGALIGALLVNDVHIVAPLATALALTAVVAAATHVLGRTEPQWIHVD
jgi:uncharacterized membrane protein YoaK (UPF0700 family)